jgi:hypothetical protein
MKAVGDHLAEVAKNESAFTTADLFGRSAFNRYYYATFLGVRETLQKIDSRWATPTHKDVPEVLRGEVLNRAKTQIKTLKQTGYLTDGQAAALKSKASVATAELACLMTRARATRRLSDYEPETKITKSGDVIKMGECSLTEARSWSDRADAFSKTILKVYADIGLI